MIKLKWQYLIVAVLIFLVEVFIALYLHDRIIRPYVGDILVVILIYCFLKSFLNYSTITIAIPVLVFSFFVELLQYFKIVEIFGLQNSTIACTNIGTSFAWTDLLMYAMGIGIVIFVEKMRTRKINT